VNASDENYLKLWANKPDTSIESFGGLHNTQFTTRESLQSFDEAFDKVLIEYKINTKHKDNLLYLIRFYDVDDGKQSLSDNDHNRLIEYARFILDIHHNSMAHIGRYIKNKEYQTIYDEGPNEYFFVKKSLLEKYSIEEIIEYRPNQVPGDAIYYMRFNVGLTELYVPYDLIFNLSSTEKLKNFEGAETDDIKIPSYLQSELFKYTFNFMIEAHERANSEFYQAISCKTLNDEDFKKLYNQYRRKSPKQNGSIIKLSVVISDYLIQNNLLSTKRSIASFLFKYFALFKVLRIKSAVSFPDSYEELFKFYFENNVTPETIRLLMKDV